MMMDRIEHEECLEALWRMQEGGEDSVEKLALQVHGEFDVRILEDMSQEGLVELSDDKGRVLLTAQGMDYSRMVARRHRLAERLLYDVMGNRGDQFEAGACEFEHVVDPALVNSICTLLGHPEKCPHGRPIPSGECCQKALRLVECAPTPLTQMKVSEQGWVAFIKSPRDEQIHRLDALHIRPGVMLKLHQTYPSYVIECEGARIALEEKVAQNIHLWVDANRSGS
jgi:DtxR family Mn-dependent transcriptional regulator